MCVTQWSLVCAGFSWLLHQCDIINVPCSLYRHAHHWEDNGDPLPRPTTPTITESMAIQCVCVLPRGLINISIPPVLSPAHTLSTESLPEFIVHHTMEELCMPCWLVLPRDSAPSPAQPIPRRRPAGVQQALEQVGGVCSVGRFLRAAILWCYVGRVHSKFVRACL